MKHSAQLRTGLIITASILALAVAEVALRAIRPVRTTGIQQSYQYDSVLGVRLRESIHLFRLTDHLEEVRSNRFGTANFQDDFNGYPELIFALGDSYTQGTGLPADQSYPTQLDLKLNRDSTGLYTKRLGVVNLGLAAYGGEQSLLVLERYSRMLGNPVACLYLGSDNDFDDDLLFRNGDRHRHVVLGSPKWGVLAPALMWVGNLQLVLRIKLTIASRHADTLRAKALLEEGSKAEQQDSLGHPENMTGSVRSPAELEWPVIQRILSNCQSRRAIVVLAWSKPPGTSGSYEWLRAKAATANLPFNDWYSRAASVRSAIPSLPIMNPHSGGHYRGWVAGEIAAGFAAELARATGSYRVRTIRFGVPSGKPRMSPAVAP